MTRYFTREEAEALLPEITIVLRKIQAYTENVRSLEEQLEDLHERSRGNGHGLSDRTTEIQKSLRRDVEALRKTLSDLQNFGCELKDPTTGLIDFLSLRDGQEIYLCWQLGEERILYWHNLDAGFVGRQPL